VEGGGREREREREREKTERERERVRDGERNLRGGVAPPGCGLAFTNPPE
jgi:hypothetical protein